MPTIRVAVHGIYGKMGQEVLKTVCKEDGLTPVGAVDARANDTTLTLPDGSGTVPLATSLDKLSGNIDVIVDFSSAEGAMTAIRTATARKINVVIGTTGLSESDYAEAKKLAEGNNTGVFIAPNFAIGAVLLMHLARIAGKHFEYADLVETHHEAKIDAPSGTALAIAKAAAEARSGPFKTNKAEKETLPGTRGGTLNGVSVHSVRMPGRVAHHEILFGGLGQTLSIRHDSINRESFMPGVVAAVKFAVKTPGLTVGLEKVLGL
ncbi:MAG: 4-hydroxy-tetrahydrodipicolinate reductase [Chloroflexi bacterium]|nr:4-hydroxy-tetrahydrodipicolinate reductase [Chloroflexota bacterium]